MDSEISLKGDWWLPNTPECKVRGDAVYVPGEGTTLVLEGHLIEEEGKKHGPSRFVNPELILGYSTSGKEITLRNCLQTGMNQDLGSGDIHETTFHASMMLVGCHFPTEEAVKFRGFTVQFANLNYWMNKKGILTEFKEGAFLAKTQPQPEETKLRVGNRAVTFSLGTSWSVDKESVHIVEKASVKTWVDNELGVDEHVQFLRHIQDFLTFAMLKPTMPLKIEGFTDSSMETLPDGKEFHVPIEIYYPSAARVSNPSITHAHEMLFLLPLVEPRIQDLVQKWVSRSEALQPVCDLYFSTLYNPNVYSDFKFLTLTQAVETYHRRAFGGKYQPDEQYLDGLYRRLVAALPSDIESDFRESLKNGKLRYANDYSLRKRLELLTARVVEIVPLTFIEDASRRREFAEKVSDTRNYLTHYSPELKERSASKGKEYYDLADKLRVLIEICLLEEMGFEADTIRELIERNRRYETYLRHK
jgi:ApeA N-terminal domain 1